MQTDVQPSSRSQQPPRAVAFGLASEQCELLLAFEMTGSLSDLAALVGRDISVVSRALQKIAQAAPVLEKHQGKWRLSRLGRDVNNWTRDAAAAQRRLLQQRSVLRIAATREFAARILAPGLAHLLSPTPTTTAQVLTSEDGVERLLLSGEADIGFDCGSPEDATVKFRRVQPERFAVVASPRFLARHPVRARDELLKLPHLQYKRSSTPRMLQLCYEVPHVLASFNDIATIREAAAAGLGWAVLPVYAVKAELKSGALKTVPGWKIEDEHFGVWWLRSRTSLEPWVEQAVRWLKGQKLS